MPNNAAKHYKWMVTSRVVAAAIPGFILTNTFSIMMTFLWPAEKLVAIAWVMLLAFMFYTALIMWIFHTKSLVRVWSVLVISILFTSGVSWWFIQAEKVL